MPLSTPHSPNRPGASSKAGVGLLFVVLLGVAGCTRSRASHSEAAPVATRAEPADSTSATASIQTTSFSSASAPGAPPTPPPELRAGGGVASDRGMVVSVEANATRAGVAMLERGGNAVDAAVAVGFALAVTHPSAGNIGGGGFMLVRLRGSPTTAIDFRERAPAAITQDRFDRMIAADAVGPAAVGVPGTVRGFLLAHRRYGRVPLTEVLAPARALATKGFVLARRQADTIRWAWPWLRRDPSARAIFGRGNAPLPVGARLIQRDLGRTLERIASAGEAGFYEGPTAEALVRAMGSSGMVSLDDLKQYGAVVREPLSFSYRGLKVEVAPPPSAGGVAVAQMLLAREALRTFEKPRASAEELHDLVEIARRVHPTRRFDVVDPDSVPGYDLRAKVRQWLDVGSLLAKAAPIDPAHATRSEIVHPLYEAAMRELEHTTHFSVSDKDGNVVSCTTTLSAGFGARVVAAGTGVVLNNSVAAFGTVGMDVPAPGRRMTSSMAPTLVLRGDDVVLVLGSPGGDTIPNTVVQVLRNLVDYGLTIDAAIDAPRIHHGFVPDEIRYERLRPIDPSVRKKLEAIGHRISKKTLPIGDANDLLIDGRTSYGHADPREGGLALGPAVTDAP